MKALFWIGQCSLIGTLIRVFKRHGVSHAEIMFSDGVSGTSEPKNGVVLRKIDFRPEDWFVLELPCTPIQEEVVRAFFVRELGCPYDWKGILCAQILGWNRSSPEAWFCSEICIASLQTIYKQLADVVPASVDPSKELTLLEVRVMPPEAPAPPAAP